MNVQRAGHQNAVDVFHIENPAIVVDGLKAGRYLSGFVKTSGIDIRNHNHLGIGQVPEFALEVPDLEPNSR